jgi:hypothetical protein
MAIKQKVSELAVKKKQEKNKKKKKELSEALRKNLLRRKASEAS